MRASFKKAFAVVAATGAISLGGSAVAHATDRAQVPDVAGMTIPQATEAFYEAGFDNVTANVPDSQDPVIGTNFQAGTYVNENASILLIVPSR
ncbi:PASTA domain-containing protein [Rhodococcoides kyotonense]|uniref:PASTA domain-containing protein n=1 Tax=Rhodococcoides kyotonense TaxID=398843 RepID=A0A239EKB6_9NOCA|nr:PASTA domain-containing protein [Rhodococcus kyotonensis]SNS45210.1 PASTA domain-containing protein [Rhodococcus kyotonensis]